MTAPSGDFTLMLLTRDPGIAQEAVAAGIDRVFVDLEQRGKAERQRGRPTVLSGHTLADVRAVRGAIPASELLVRVDPPGDAMGEQVASVIAEGADVVMLPFFSDVDEVASFLDAVAGRARTCLLVETAAALVRLERILELGGVDEVHVGLNDLHASLGLRFMYEILAGGILDHVAALVRAAAHPVRFGFGGGALLDAPHPVSPADVLREHVRLGSRMIILSKTFTGDAKDRDELRARVDLAREVARIRAVISAARERTTQQMEEDRLRTREAIWRTAAVPARA